MKISIITVCYNSAATLEKTILSVARQTHSNIEYLIVDGNSNDGTLDIIQKHEDKITHWISESDKGLYDAMNKGITMATGDIIGILNSDDNFFQITL
jgi:glycosyltransferase involved in cell wall biosynthesis